MRKALVLLLALLTLPTGLVAQSLGEVAAQEKARREREKAKDASRKGRPKAFTDDDLQPGAKHQPTEAPPASEPYVPSAPTTPEGGETEPESGPKREWQQRAAAARQIVETARQAVSSIANDVERLRQDLNPMSLTYNPDDFNLTLRLQHELNEAETKLAAANLQVEAAEKAYKVFEDDARRSGVPSSWLE